MKTMRHKTFLVSLGLLLVGWAGCAAVASAQFRTQPPPPPAVVDAIPYSYSPWVTPPPPRNLSPVTKRRLYEHSPMVCHCDECRRMRLAAGVEYMGYEPVYTPRPQPRPRWQFCHGVYVYVPRCY